MEKIKKITSIVLAILFIVGSIAFIISVFKPKKSVVINNETNSSVGTITFSIWNDNEGNYYVYKEQVVEGTTWIEFCNSSENTYRLIIENDNLYGLINGSIFPILITPSRTSPQVKGTDVIQELCYYILEY